MKPKVKLRMLPESWFGHLGHFYAGGIAELVPGDPLSAYYFLVMLGIFR